MGLFELIADMLPSFAVAEAEAPAKDEEEKVCTPSAHWSREVRADTMPLGRRIRRRRRGEER